MLLSQYLSKDKASVLYGIENLTPQPLYYCVYRKKVVDIKLPWKRYITFAQDSDLLIQSPTEREFSALLSIWADEINTCVLTEELQPDGIRAVRVSSWTAWAARKKMAPVALKYATSKEAFIAEVQGKLVAGLEPHIHAGTVAHVRSGKTLGTHELQFLEMRQRVVREGLFKLTGQDLSPLPHIHTPRIQICASGGGYRAMIATLGSLIGLEEAGLLDCVSSIAGLSGSTWAMAAWYSGGKTLTETRDSLALKLSEPFFTRKLWPETVQSHVRERLGLDQELGLVDVMGWHLHNHLLLDLPCKQELWHKPRLSEQGPSIADGSKPLPIYTAVTHEHQRYRWMEFTPFECGIGQDINLWVPTFAFGRRFHGGVSQDTAVEPSLALMQATWGSAFCATVDQMFHELDNGDGAEPAAMRRLLHTLIYDKLEISEDRLITPAKFNNIGAAHEALGAHPWKDMKVMKLMDAGVHTNLPFPPLLRKERGSDIIICLDQSSAPDICTSVSVDIAARWAAEEVLPFPECADALKTDPALAGTPQAKHSAASKQRCTIIPGDVSKDIPTIIYLPLIRNERYSPSFCPRENALTKGGYCSTFNFAYSADNVMELSGLTHANIIDSREQIIQCIKDVSHAMLAFHGR